jgi:hypothetical protein
MAHRRPTANRAAVFSLILFYRPNGREIHQIFKFELITNLNNFPCVSTVIV